MCVNFRLPPPLYPLPPFFPSLISLMVSVDVQHSVYFVMLDNTEKNIVAVTKPNQKPMLDNMDKRLWL